MSDEELLELRYRERTRPARGDKAYAHLSDLLGALRELLVDATGVWLDYGAGSSPYRELLGEAKLVTADLPDARRVDVDLLLGPDGAIPADDESFDGVLSTQVLEHVADPAAYLRECRRVFKPSGSLVLSTHGTWEEHGPVDFWRWTADGLVAQIERAGFGVERCVKLTGDERAVLTLLRRQSRATAWPLWHPVGFLLRVLRWVDRLRPAWFDAYADRHFSRPEGRDDRGPRLYLAVVVVARPSASPVTPAP